MKPGPKPKPAAVRAKQAGVGRDRGHRPLPGGLRGEGEPEKPRFMSELAEAEWDRVVPDLVREGIAVRAHSGPLTAMCVAWGVAETARQVYEEQGLVEEGSMGQMVEHPMLRTYQNAISQYMRIATEFGLTASAAMRIETAQGIPEPFHDIGLSPRLRAVK